MSYPEFEDLFNFSRIALHSLAFPTLLSDFGPDFIFPPFFEKVSYLPPGALII